MLTCKLCNSTRVHFKGAVVSYGESKRRYKCQDCSGNFYVTSTEPVDISTSKRDSVSRYVITACQNNTEVNEEFLQALKVYCSHNNGTLMIAPIVYRADDHELIEYLVPEEFKTSIISSKMIIHDEVHVLGSFNFIPTTVNPLAGLESISKGNTLIVPSPQLRMKSLAVSASRHPAILITTGAISYPHYVSSKVGEKAKFNHSYSAVVVEIDSDNDYHIRVLNSDDTGSFYDLDTKYTPTGVMRGKNIQCLITGDEHAIFASPQVEQCTYTNEDSIVNVLKPSFVVRHDVLDCYSISHHHKKDSILSVGKYMFKMNTVKDELDSTISYINRTSGNYKNIIVSSNHNDHLTRWLKETDIKTEPWNAKVYHKMMYEILESMEQTSTGVSYPDPFSMYAKEYLTNTVFLGRDQSFEIDGIELNAHGDIGMNGSRGSVGQYGNMSQKYVIGHSHTPGIVFGAYQVGTSSHLKLEYSKGPSSWMNTHCIIHENGKRQLINIINGKWRAK